MEFPFLARFMAIHKNGKIGTIRRRAPGCWLASIDQKSSTKPRSEVPLRFPALFRSLLIYPWDSRQTSGQKRDLQLASELPLHFALSHWAAALTVASSRLQPRSLFTNRRRNLRRKRNQRTSWFNRRRRRS